MSADLLELNIVLPLVCVRVCVCVCVSVFVCINALRRDMNALIRADPSQLQ